MFNHSDSDNNVDNLQSTKEGGVEKAPIVHRTIREQVVAHLRHAVLSGELGEGEALREQLLARHFGVS